MPRHNFVEMGGRLLTLSFGSWYNQRIRNSISGSSNGRTADSGSAYLGSQPKADPPLAENLRLRRISLWLTSPAECMYFIYILRSVDYGTRYIGSTESVEKRLKEHNAGKVRYTKGRKPWKLIYQEAFMSRGEARKREIFLKTGQGRQYLDNVFGVV